ncbi:MAG: hypothetical protein QNJ11_13310 [Woeseiaceae bacterium]|nr:hypothetical protein [Woeseiaceae bacterium]
MATAEKMLHEAYFAFNSISYGETPGNKRNKRRATSLCHKILRRYPGTTEAAEAHAILMRLGEEAYTSQLSRQHTNITQEAHPAPRPAPQTATTATGQNVETLDWAGLIGWLLSLPKLVLGLILAGGFVLFGVLGPLLFVPLVLLVLFTGPFRGMLKPEQRRQIDDVVVSINRVIREQRA